MEALEPIAPAVDPQPIAGPALVSRRNETVPWGDEGFAPPDPVVDATVKGALRPGDGIDPVPVAAGLGIALQEREPGHLAHTRDGTARTRGQAEVAQHFALDAGRRHHAIGA